jgi:hypothetical protein
VCQQEKFIFAKFHVQTTSSYFTGEEEMQDETEKMHTFFLPLAFSYGVVDSSLCSWHGNLHLLRGKGAVVLITVLLSVLVAYCQFMAQKVFSS